MTEAWLAPAAWWGLAADQAPVGTAAGKLTEYGPLGILALAALAFFYIAWRREASRADKWEAVALRLVEQNARLLIGAEVAVDVLKQVPQKDPS